jgi:hypothetical protein
MWLLAHAVPLLHRDASSYPNLQKRTPMGKVSVVLRGRVQSGVSRETGVNLDEKDLPRCRRQSISPQQGLNLADITQVII